MESFPFHQYPYNFVLLLAASIYFSNRYIGCPDEKAVGVAIAYEVLVCAGHSPGVGNFRLNDTERVVVLLLAMFGIFGNVIPKSSDLWISRSPLRGKA